MDANTGTDARSLSVAECEADEQIHLSRDGQLICCGSKSVRPLPYVPVSVFQTADPWCCLECRQMLTAAACAVCGADVSPGDRLCSAACGERLGFDVCLMNRRGRFGSETPENRLHLLDPGGNSCASPLRVRQCISRDVRDFLNPPANCTERPCTRCRAMLDKKLKGIPR